MTIIGEPVSKANSRQIVNNNKTGKQMVIKSPKARAYERDARIQVPFFDRLLDGPLRATIHLYYRSHRPDLDESIVLDVMQTRNDCPRGLYNNDRQVREKHVYHHIDKLNPRAEIVVEEME